MTLLVFAAAFTLLSAVAARPEGMSAIADNAACTEGDALAADAAVVGGAGGAMSALQHSVARQRHSVDPPKSTGLWGMIESAFNLAAIAEIMAEVKLNEAQPADDPYWSKAGQRFLDAFVRASPRYQAYIDACNAGDLERFSAMACAEPYTQKPKNGQKPDAWWCGRNDGADWGNWGGPRVDVCNLEGKMLGPGSPCDVGTKRLLLNNVAMSMNVSKDIRLMNLPGLDCLSGIADCDKYYCHHCEGMCPPK